ncbi:nucleoside 2-deoxyribosyltransferase [Pseudomonas koreensis]|uniref:nucleoside 2-deoxyribosyltransferase n=1 Tax=Pseudomonas koreensis TaxID=198620 RepID=UPI0021CA8FAE|nr:nucleoside 2-deoxyribosyltransferase [Pseudomonas koreensis]MCU0093824.1 nucleoside 2-deoxyribosyltransferase [Pseudomonas koreensis]
MDIKDIYTIFPAIGAIAVVLGTLMYVMSKLRNDRYDLELKKMHLDVMRQSLERKSYEANDLLMSDPSRWKNVNHLLLEAIKSQDSTIQEEKTGPFNTSFFDAAGIDIGKIKEIKKRVFVLTPFHPKYEPTYHTIKNVCTRLGLECMRGDEQFKPGAVLSHILELIAQASIVIVNIDGRNPNVYYELGIAHAMGKKTILVASDIESVPFDMKAQRIVLHKSKTELEHNLTSSLARSVVDN